VKYDEEARWLLMDRGGMQVMMNLGDREAVFPVPGEFRLILCSRPEVTPKDGRLAVPGSSIAIISCEQDLQI
jgi:maltooligosyltrehalose trehalohydrolase